MQFVRIYISVSVGKSDTNHHTVVWPEGNVVAFHLAGLNLTPGRINFVIEFSGVFLKV